MDILMIPFFFFLKDTKRMSKSKFVYYPQKEDPDFYRKIHHKKEFYVNRQGKVTKKEKQNKLTKEEKKMDIVRSIDESKREE